ncbi:MAG: hypothetical protein U1E70_23960 [Acetobacteraceae bacterium]
MTIAGVRAFTTAQVRVPVHGADRQPHHHRGAGADLDGDRRADLGAGECTATAEAAALTSSQAPAFTSAASPA